MPEVESAEDFARNCVNMSALGLATRLAAAVTERELAAINPYSATPSGSSGGGENG